MTPPFHRSRAFLEAAAPGPRGPVDEARLEGALAAALAAGRTRWPDVSLAPERFARHLGERLARAEAVEQANAADLYLACGCLGGDAAALKAFEREYLGRARAVVQRFAKHGGAEADLLQTLRQKLLVGDERRPPRLSQYQGTGSLANWIRAVAMRTGISEERVAPREALEPDAGVAERAPGADVELEFIRRRYRADFAAAFQSVLAALPDDERELLREHVLEGQGIDQLAARYKIHRSTVARKVARIRQRLLEATRAALAERLSISKASLDSLIVALRSNLDVSVERFLAPEK